MNRREFWRRAGSVFAVIALVGGLILAGNITSTGTNVKEVREVCLIGVAEKSVQPDSGGPVLMRIVAAPQEVDKTHQAVMFPLVLICSHFNFPDTLFVPEPEKEETHEVQDLR